MTRTRKPTEAEVALYRDTISPLLRRYHDLMVASDGSPGAEFTCRVLRAKADHLTYTHGFALRPQGLRVVLCKSPASEFIPF